MTPLCTGKKKILEENESESEWGKDVDAAIEQAISRVIRTEEARNNLRDLIASITTKELAAAKPAPTTTQQTLTKSPAIAPRVSSKRKGAQPSRGATTLEEPEKT